MKCIECGAEMAPATLPIQREVAGHTFTATIRGRRCGACGAELYEGEEARRFEAMIKVALGRWKTGEGGPDR